MHDRFVLLKRERDLTDQEVLSLSGWTKNYDELGLAYRLQEDFFGIYDARAPDEAQARYIDWKRRITGSCTGLRRPRAEPGTTGRHGFWATSTIR